MTRNCPEFRLPGKRYEIRNRTCDSTRWNDVEFCDGDIVVATYGKAGTTWTQQIVMQLILNGCEGVFGITPAWEWPGIPLPIALSYLDARVRPRVLKTHLPVAALGIDERVRYIYVARDIRDVVLSAHNHVSRYTPEALAQINASSVGSHVNIVACSIRDFYIDFLQTGRILGFGSSANVWEHLRGWWELRNLPNVQLVHFNNLKRNLSREIRSIAQFLRIPIHEPVLPKIVEHCSFSYMRENSRTSRALNFLLAGGADTFFLSGKTGRWRTILSEEEIARADAMAIDQLSPECAHWLRTGEISRNCD